MKKTEADELVRARGGEVDVYQAPTNTVFMLYMHSQKPPFNNPDLRRAVNLALDRQELVAKGLDGAGVPCAVLDPKLAGDFALPLEEVNRLPGCRQPKDQDVAEAKRLVEKHYPNGLDIEAVVRAVSGNVDKGQLVVAQLRKIGIRATLRTYESAAGFAVYGKGDFTLIAAQDRAMVGADPSDIFGLIYTTQSGSNFGKWSDPKVDELTDRGLREANRDKRRQIYHELQRYILTHDASAIPVAWIEGYFFRDKRVQNYKASPTFYDHFTFMKVWLAQ
jgi:peptide/nickel transport system substrate-binding protein